MSLGGELVGSTIGAYRIDAPIGAGATGVVYRATRAEDERPVALKVLHENLGSITGLERRFSREARVLTKLSHPNIVEVLDFGTAAGRTFIAMELLEGRTLEDILQLGPIDPARAIAFADPILDALAAAHEREVVHRDLKPANVFLTRPGDHVKLLDFGLAKMLSIDELSQEGTLTRKGRVVGTPAYMAPEQITGISIDVRADVYAFGVMLYELLADRRPFLYERRSELLRAHLLEPVPEITAVRPGLWVHPELAALLACALAKDPMERYADGRALLAAVRALPPDCVRIEASHRDAPRQRTATTSTVISESERHAITESAGVAPPATPPAHDRPIEPAPTRRVPTAALFALALALLMAAAALWLFLMPRA